MTLSIDINDQELKEVVEKGIKELSSETVGEIVKEAIKNYMQDPEVMKELLFEREKGYGYTYFSNPQKWFLDLFTNCFSPEEIQEYRQKILSIVEQEKEGIIVKTLAEMFSKLLVTDEFRYQLQDSIAHIVRN